MGTLTGIGSLLSALYCRGTEQGFCAFRFMTAPVDTAGMASFWFADGHRFIIVPTTGFQEGMRDFYENSIQIGACT